MVSANGQWLTPWLLLAGVISGSAGCSPEPQFERYTPYMGKYSLEVPKGWNREDSNHLDARPNSHVRFVGAVTARSYGGSPLGAVVMVHKAYRLRRDHPGSDAEFKEHEKDLKRLDEKFFRSLSSGITDGTLAGLPAKISIDDFSEDIEKRIVREALSMRSELVITRTNEAYYALRYTATKELFPTHHAAFERMRSSFQIVPERVIPKAKETRSKSRGLELSLSLGRNSWTAPEMLWYRLSARNTSLRPIYLTDAFWWDQYALNKNQSDLRRTYFEVQSPDGKSFKANFMLEWGFHGEFAFWTNSCDEGSDCRESRGIAVEILPGQRVSPTPSLVAPVRKQNEFVMGLTDARIDCRGTTSERKTSEDLFNIAGKFKRKLGQPQDMGDICGPSAPLYPGMRILEGFHFHQPGRYKIRAVFDDQSDHAIQTKSKWVDFDVLPGQQS